MQINRFRNCVFFLFFCCCCLHSWIAHKILFRLQKERIKTNIFVFPWGMFASLRCLKAFWLSFNSMHANRTEQPSSDKNPSAPHSFAFQSSWVRRGGEKKCVIIFINKLRRQTDAQVVIHVNADQLNDHQTDVESYKSLHYYIYLIWTTVWF